MLAQIGQGGYGKVYLAKTRKGQMCALKQMNKKSLAKMNEVDHILTERDILTQTADTPWLVKLFYAFQDPECIYLAMVCVGF
jgi:serine/threonine protein kinase